MAVKIVVDETPIDIKDLDTEHLLELINSIIESETLNSDILPLLQRELGTRNEN